MYAHSSHCNVFPKYHRLVLLPYSAVSASKLLLENASVKEGDFVTIFPFDVSSADVLPATSVVVQFVDKLNKSTDSVGKDLKEPFVRGYIKEALGLYGPPLCWPSL